MKYFDAIPPIGMPVNSGTADHYYQQAIEHLPKDRIVVDGADHAMEISGDSIQSIEFLKQVNQATLDTMKFLYRKNAVRNVVR